MSLQKQLADLQQKFEQQAAIDQRVHEISARLEKKQERRGNGNGIGDFIQTVGTLMTQERQSARMEFKAAVEEVQRSVETKLAALEHRNEQRIVQHIEQCSRRIHGLSDVMATERPDRQNEIKAAFEEIQLEFDAKLEALEQRLKAVPGKLPVAKIWDPESVTYRSEFVCHEGSLYQAKKDTAQAPGGSDWVCVARAGRDAITPAVRGTYSFDENYQELDIVGMDGGSFIACKDNPGICPGPDWQLLCRQGKTGRQGAVGPRGERGEKGERGEDGATTVSWQLDRANYRMSPLMSNGTVGPMQEFRGMFEQFLIDRGEL